MTEKKKMGRPSQGKVWRSFTADKEVADFLDSLPSGDRSRFVNEAVADRIREVKALSEIVAELTFADNLRNGLDEQTNVPRVDK